MATVCDKLKLRRSDTSLGRYWIANESIKCGTLLIRECPLASIPNTQINGSSITDPIPSTNNAQCWNCCSLFPRRSSSNPHYCSDRCCNQSSVTLNILLNPSLPFTKLIQNDCTLRLTIFMMIKMINHCATNQKQSWFTDMDSTFALFQKEPDAFYQIFHGGNQSLNHSTSQCPDLLQCTISNTKHNALYNSYRDKLRQIVPELLSHFNLSFLNNTNLFSLSVRFLNMVFINGFGIRYSVLHDDDMLGLALFHRSSYFNHSCSPNAFYYFESGHIHIRSLRDIEPNEAVTISIVEDLESHSKPQRQQMIEKHFGFKCLCIRCIDSEYVDNDCLLQQREEDTDCIMNDKTHCKLLQFARSNWAKHPENAWKFYQRLFGEYRYHYHPFDPDVMALLQEIAQRAYTMKDYQTGYDAAELGKEFANRLTGCGVVDNCHLKEFRFMFLSFCHYVHLVRDKLPHHRMKDIMNMKLNDIMAEMDDIGVTPNELVAVDDDDKAQVMEQSVDNKKANDHEHDDIDDDEDDHKGTPDAMSVKWADTDGPNLKMMNDDVLLNMFRDETVVDTKQSTKINGHLEQTKHVNGKMLNSHDDNQKITKKKKKNIANEVKSKDSNDTVHSLGSFRSTGVSSAKMMEMISNEVHGRHRNMDRNKDRRENHVMKVKGKQKGNKNDNHNAQGDGKGKVKKRSNQNARRKRKLNNGNVQIYSFGTDGMQTVIGDDDNDEVEVKEGREDCDSVEQELNDKIIELCAARAVLFPQFEDFEQWVGKDMKALDPTVWSVVNALRGKFETDSKS